MFKDNKVNSQKARQLKFEKYYNEYRTDGNEKLIPGHKERDPTNSCLLKFMNIKGLKLPKQIKVPDDWDTKSAQFHMTFLYEKGTKKFFFGRSTRSSLLELKEGAGNSWGTDSTDYVYLHTNLNQKKGDLDKNVKLVIECVIICEREYRGATETKFLSGGYCVFDIFQSGNEGQMKELLEGTPRDLITEVEGLRSTATISLQFKSCPQLDHLKDLVPQNNLVSKNDIIPGLLNLKENSVCGTFEVPQISSKDKKAPPQLNERDKPLVQQKSEFYINNLQIQTSHSIEEEVEAIMQKLFVENNRKTDGTAKDAESITVNVRSKSIQVRCHNTWMYLNQPVIANFGKPDFMGVQTADPILIKDVILSELMAITFVLLFEVEINNKERLQVCMGYQKYMPRFDDKGIIEDVLTFQLLKGPGENYENQLIISEESVFYKDFNVFDIVLTGQLSQAAQKGQGERLPLFQSQLSSKPVNFMSPPNMDISRDRTSSFVPRASVAQTIQANSQSDNFYVQQLQQEVQNLKETMNQQALSGGFQPGSDDYVRALELQKDQLNNETKMLKQYMEEFKEEMFRLQNEKAGSDNTYGGGFSSGGKGNSQVQMQQIGNVFYNMLNMMGAQQNDQRIIGLSNDLREMIQTQQFDNLFQNNVPFPGQEQINLLRTIDMSNKDQAKLMVQGLGDLLHHPTAQVMSSGIIKEKIDLEKEAMDRFKASQIQIKFVAYKTPKGSQARIPKKFQFQFRFFTFPDVVTDYLSLQLGEDQTGQGIPIYKPDTAYLLQKSMFRKNNFEEQHRMGDDNLVMVSFDVDPSMSKIPDEHIKLAKYLKERYLTVDLFDAQTRFYFGSCKIPLFELCRQGVSQIVRPKECEIFNPQTNEYQGALQVILSNEGKAMSDKQIGDQEFSSSVGVIDVGKSRKQPTQGKPTKKVIVSKPMDQNEIRQSQATFSDSVANPGLGQTYQSNDYTKTMMNQLSESQLAASKTNQDLRKKLRADRIRKMTMGNNIGSNKMFDDPKQPDWMKFQSLREIDMIRQSRKDMIINQVMGGYLGDSQVIHVIPGQISFMSIPIENMTGIRQVFEIRIEDPDAKNTEHEEVQMVYSGLEFEYWVKKGKVKKPNTYDMVPEKNKVMLGPGEKLDALFKFLTFREVSHNVNTAASPDIVKQRNVKITILLNRSVYNSYEINMMPLFPPIDHVFRYFEPENSYFRVRIPPFLQFSQTGLNVKVSKATAQAEIDQTTSQLHIQSKTGEALKVSAMMVYVYNDQFMSETLASFKIEVTPLNCVYSQTRAGVQNAMSLILPPTNGAKMVEIYSDNNKNVFLNDRSLQNQFPVNPHTNNFIAICTKTFTSEQKKVIINAVDTESGQLIYSWLLILASQPPVPNRWERLTAKVNTDTLVKLRYHNKVKRDMVFEVASSRPDLMEPRTSHLSFRANEAQDIEIDIRSQQMMGKGEAFLYISDTEQYVMECISLEIMFIK